MEAMILKKAFFLLFLLIVVSIPAFSIINLMPAGGMGQGKWGLMLYDASNHSGPGANNDEPTTYYDAHSTGLMLSYGVMDDLDMYGYYSLDDYLNIKGLKEDMEDLIHHVDPYGSLIFHMNNEQTSGGGIKYTFMKKNAYDVSFDLGYEFTMTQIDYHAFYPLIPFDYGQTIDTSYASWQYGLSFSRKGRGITPYLTIGGRSIFEDTTDHQNYALSALVYSTFICIGVELNIYNGISVLAEAQHENQYWGETKGKGLIMEAGGRTNSGGNIGLVWNF